MAKTFTHVWTQDDVSKDAQVYEISGKLLISFPNAHYGFPRYAIQVFGLTVTEGSWDDVPDLTNCIAFQECDISGIIKKNPKTIIFDRNSGKVGIAL